MTQQYKIFIILLLLINQLSSCYHKDPPIRELSTTKNTKPWTYWWWMGSAVNRKEITRHLEAYKNAGIGGVHIIPIYGVEGYEDEFIPYLSDKWIRMLTYTIKEAERL